jgi:hypothetical protein
MIDFLIFTELQKQPIAPKNNQPNKQTDKQKQNRQTDAI